ncbi:MAG: DUF5688 family protein [Saccharofermentans sp.]|nr:DUF5688 family protein [Saccharofermentans sp.]
MHDYEGFKKQVAEDIIGYMGDGYETYEVKIIPYEKKGRKCDGISICLPKTVKGRCVMPTLSINELYEEYVHGEDYEKQMRRVAKTMKNGIKMGKKLLPETDYRKAKEKIVFQLVNTASNEEMLAGIPHRGFLDLSVIYRWGIDFSDNGVASVLITNDLMELMGLDEEELYACARENTMRLLPPVFKDIRDLIGDFMDEDEFIPDMPKGQRMYVITNRYNFAGANAMLLENVLYNISKEIDSDLLILPASINELIILSASEEKDPEVLSGIVSEINQYDVDKADRLSDSVYYYSSSTRRIYITSERRMA